MQNLLTNNMIVGLLD